MDYDLLRVPIAPEMEFKFLTWLPMSIHLDLASPTSLLLLCPFNKPANYQTHPGLWAYYPFSLGRPHPLSQPLGNFQAQHRSTPFRKPSRAIQAWAAGCALCQVALSRAHLPRPVGSSPQQHQLRASTPDALQPNAGASPAALRLALCRPWRTKVQQWGPCSRGEPAC